MVTTQRRNNWIENFDTIERDYDRACQWWHKNKSCDCDSEETGKFCIHFENLLAETMGKRILESWKEMRSIHDEDFKELIKLAEHKNV